jgi:hypothetical protein
MSLELAGKLVGVLGGVKDLFSKSKSAGKVVRSRVAGAMRAAEEHGLHPLEVLGTAAMGAQPQQPRLGTHTALVNGFDKLDDVLSGRQATRDRLMEAQADLAEIQADRMRTGATGTQIPTTIVEGVKTGGPVRPRLRPTAENQQRTPVFLPDGPEVLIPKSLADNLGLANWGQMGSGQYSEIVGEIRGEAESTLLLDKVGENMGIPLGGPKNKNYGFTEAGLEAALGRELTDRERRRLRRGGSIEINGVEFFTRKPKQ